MQKFCIFIDVFFKEPPVFNISTNDSIEEKKDSVFHSLSYLSNDDDNYEFSR